MRKKRRGLELKNEKKEEGYLRWDRKMRKKRRGYLRWDICKDVANREIYRETDVGKKINEEIETDEKIASEKHI